MTKFRKYTILGFGLGVVILLCGIVILIMGTSLFIASWTATAVLTNDRQFFEKTEFTTLSSIQIQNVTSSIQDGSKVMNGFRTISLFLIFSGAPIFAIGIWMTQTDRKDLDKITGDKKSILDLTPTSVTIIFSVLFAISLMFGAAANEIILETHQTFFLMSTIVENSQNELGSTISLLNNFIIKFTTEFLYSVLHASFVGQIGFLFLLARVFQIIKHRENNSLSKTFVLLGMITFFLWIVFFIGILLIPTENIIDIDIPNPLSVTEVDDFSK